MLFGIQGNEEADALTRAGSSSVFVGPEPCLPLAPSSVEGVRREREWLLKSHYAEFGNCLSSVVNVAEKAQSRLNEILNEAA
jgi:hypothetical protein